jgi:hypothetical protein
MRLNFCTAVNDKRLPLKLAYAFAHAHAPLKTHLTIQKIYAFALLVANAIESNRVMTA